MSDDFYFCSHCGHEGGLGGEAVQEEIIDKIMEAIENKYAGLTRKDVEGLIEELIALEQRIINDEYLCNGCHEWHTVNGIHYDYAEMRQKENE